MGIRQRTWEWKGKQKSAWIVDYFDLKGKRRLKTFRTKREASDFAATTRIDIKRGVHVADSASITVGEAGQLWLATGKENGLVRSSLQQNQQHLDLHITPFMGSDKLTKLTVPAIRAFEGDLRANGRSAAMTKKVLASLGAIIADAQERGLASHNPAREMRRNRGRRRTKGTKERKRQLAVGVDIPTPAEIRAILSKAAGFRRAFFATAALAGLRSSELRGLRWQDVDFAKGAVSVWQRADLWGQLDEPKSQAGYRTIPVPQLVVHALKEWKLACPKGDLAFPNRVGRAKNHGVIIRRHWHPLQLSAGMAVPTLDKAGMPVLDDQGEPAMRAKYGGIHCLRHFFASWCAARPQDGGLGLPLKTVQVRMGHSTLAMTSDVYGHLFPSQDDAEVLAAGEAALMRA